MGDTASGNAEPFAGRIRRTFAGSDGWWPPRPTPTEGAPDIIVMLVDDLGFADIGCYGSEIPTPHVDALARNGRQFTNFHSAPMCSPSRASLLTGLDPHRAGFGTVAHLDPGFPGYAMEFGDDVITLPEILRQNGWATLMVGKWHLAKDSDCSAAGPMHSWPLQRGFDRFYGILDAFTNLHHPHRLTSDNSVVEVDDYPDGYYLTDDLTDRAIAMMRERAASRPDQPIFLYFAHGAVHAPLLAKASDIERHRGRYDHGWDALRDERFARQLELGVVPPHTALPARNDVLGHEVEPWEDVEDRLRPLLSRHMEVYAAMVDNVDQNLGRLLAAQRELGRLENTIVVFTSDNGASREGEQWGTTAYYAHLLADDEVGADMARLDEIGGPTTTPHYPRGWAMASGTPWRLYKINTHRGGHSVPFVVSWPAGLGDGRGFQHDYCHISDLTPTLLDLCGLQHPANATADPPSCQPEHRSLMSYWAARIPGRRAARSTR